MSDTPNNDNVINQRTDISSSEVKDIKFVKSSNAFEVALEYQKQLIHKEYEYNKLLGKVEKAREDGKKEALETFEADIKKLKSQDLKSVKTNFFIRGVVTAVIVLFLIYLLLQQ